MNVLEGYIPFSDSIPKLVATLRVLFDEVPIIYSHHRQHFTGDQQSSVINYPPRTQMLQIERDGSLIPEQARDSTNWSGLENQLESVQLPIITSMTSTSEDNPIMDLNGMVFDPNDLSWLDALPFEF